MYASHKCNDFFSIAKELPAFSFIAMFKTIVLFAEKTPSLVNTNRRQLFDTVSVAEVQISPNVSNLCAYANAKREKSRQIYCCKWQ